MVIAAAILSLLVHMQTYEATRGTRHSLCRDRIKAMAHVLCPLIGPDLTPKYVLEAGTV